MDTNTPTTTNQPAANQDDKLKHMRMASDPNAVREKALRIIGDPEENKSYEGEGKIDIVKGMSLYEFDNAVLMSMGISDINTPFAIDLMRKIQKEFDCQSTSEKATAELAASSYARMLDIQKLQSTFMSKESYGELTVRVIATLGKELDRAQRQYLTAIQTLRTLRQPPMQLTIRADTAVVGQNQMVQTNQ